MNFPESVRALLHEYDTSAGTDGPAWERAAMERVMLRGLLEDMRWLLATFGRDRLRTFLAERGAGCCRRASCASGARSATCRNTMPTRGLSNRAKGSGHGEGSLMLEPGVLMPFGFLDPCP